MAQWWNVGVHRQVVVTEVEGVGLQVQIYSELGSSLQDLEPSCSLLVQTASQGCREDRRGEETGAGWGGGKQTEPKTPRGCERQGGW